MGFRIPSVILRWLPLGLALFAAVLGVGSRHLWWPRTLAWVQGTVAAGRTSSTAHEEHAGEAAGEEAHAHGDHGHAHDESESLVVSAQALHNLGLSAEWIRPIQLQTFRRSLAVRALVVERPGRSRLQVATPMTGVVTHVHCIQGEAVEPGTLLFQIRLTHEDLVEAQTNFLRSLGELDVERREVARLEAATSSGAIAGKVLLERLYAKEKLEAILDAQREALRLHGLSVAQVDAVAKQRRLLRELSVYAPGPDDHPDDELRLTGKEVRPVSFVGREGAAPSPKAPPLILQDLHVHKGQAVAAGETLAVLANYADLSIEGLAFEQDARLLARAARENWPLTARFESSDGTTKVIEDLRIAYLASDVDVDARTLKFYVDLPNELERDQTRPDGHRFVSWTYRPGQRLQLQVPVEEWPNEIVLPVAAIAQEGPESYVFLQNGTHFDRVAVHVKHRDQHAVVVANDGVVFPGDRIALRGAHQMQMALKNKAGGGVDPHAGHNH